MQRISTLELERRKSQKAGDISRLQTIEKLLTLKVSNAGTIAGTMEVHAVFPADALSNIFVRDTSCFSTDCFIGSFNQHAKCDRW